MKKKKHAHLFLMSQIHILFFHDSGCQKIVYSTGFSCAITITKPNTLINKLQTISQASRYLNSCRKNPNRHIYSGHKNILLLKTKTIKRFRYLERDNGNKMYKNLTGEKSLKQIGQVSHLLFSSLLLYPSPFSLSLF